MAILVSNCSNSGNLINLAGVLQKCLSSFYCHYIEIIFGRLRKNAKSRLHNVNFMIDPPDWSELGLISLCISRHFGLFCNFSSESELWQLINDPNFGTYWVPINCAWGHMFGFAVLHHSQKHVCATPFNSFILHPGATTP